MSIRDRDREASVIANALNFSEPPYDKYVGSVFESIINSAVDLQNDGRK
jgi:chorismate mutase